MQAFITSNFKQIEEAALSIEKNAIDLMASIKEEVHNRIRDQVNQITDQLRKQYEDDLNKQRDECDKRVADKEAECSVVERTQITLEDNDWKQRMDDSVAHTNADWAAKYKDLKTQFDSFKTEADQRNQDYEKRIKDLNRDWDEKMKQAQHDREVSEQQIRASCKQF